MRPSRSTLTGAGPSGSGLGGGLLVGRGGLGGRGRRGLDLDLVALGAERRFGVFGQGDEIDPGHGQIGMVPFGRAVDRIEVPVGDEEEVLAVPAERGLAGVVPAVGDRDGLPGVERVEVDLGHALALGLAVGDPAAVGRPGELADLARFGRGRDRDRLRRRRRRRAAASCRSRGSSSRRATSGSGICRCRRPVVSCRGSPLPSWSVSQISSVPLRSEM